MGGAHKKNVMTHTRRIRLINGGCWNNNVLWYQNIYRRPKKSKGDEKRHIVNIEGHSENKICRRPASYVTHIKIAVQTEYNISYTHPPILYCNVQHKYKSSYDDADNSATTKGFSLQ